MYSARYRKPYGYAPYARKKYTRRLMPSINSNYGGNPRKYERYFKSPKASMNLQRLTARADFTSDASGINVTVLNDNLTGYDNYGGASALNHSYRVLAVKFTYLPFDSTGALYKNAPILCVKDTFDSAALGSKAAAMQFASVQYWDSAKRHSWSWNLLEGNDTSDWIDLNNPVACNYFKFVADGLSGAHKYGDLLIELTIQCKDRV